VSGLERTSKVTSFYDLATEKDFKLPTQAEKRERTLITPIQKHRKRVTLFVDEAHDLHYQILVKLKRLIELVRYLANYQGPELLVSHLLMQRSGTPS